MAGAQRSPEPAITLLPLPETVTSTVGGGGATTRHTLTQDGTLLPDPDLTPGATFADVTAAEVCSSAYESGIRQTRPRDQTAALVAYDVPAPDRHLYRVDNLVPLSLGGSNAAENLWPQPEDGATGAPRKDAVERRLRQLVCAGDLPLPVAQQALIEDWPAAGERYGAVATAPPEPSGSPSPVRPGTVAQGAPCAQEGALGEEPATGVRLVCARSGQGGPQWDKRY